MRVSRMPVVGRGSRSRVRDGTASGVPIDARQSFQHAVPRRSPQPVAAIDRRKAIRGVDDSGRSDRTVVGARSVQPLDCATDWSSAAIPSNRAPSVDAASAGASITTLPLGSRRTWSCEKNSRTSPDDGIAATAEVASVAPSNDREVPRLKRHSGPAAAVAVRDRATTAWSRDSSAASISSSNGSATSSSRLRVGEVGILVGHVAGRCDGLDGGRLVELLNLGQEVRRLPELDRVAVAVEQPLEERLLRADQGGDPRLDALLADQVVDVDRQLLAEAVDAADPLFEDGRVPGKLEVDHAVGRALEVQADAAGIAGEEHAEVGIVVELDDVLRPPPLAFGPGEEARAKAARRRAGRSPPSGPG